MNLKDQLFDCLPAGRYALAGLLRLVDIVETDTVPTAAVECHAQPRLLINPAFVAEHAHTPEKLMMLVLHEIHHVLLGHTRRLSGSAPADNFVFDCVINALLCRMFPQPAYTALFRDFYPDDVFPACLLRPPLDWNPAIRKVPVPPALAGRGYGPARQVYLSLYSKEGASYEDIRNVLRAFLARREKALAGVTLLGQALGERWALLLAAGLVLLAIPLASNLGNEAITGWGNAPLAAFVFPLIGLFLAPIYPAINSRILSSLPKQKHGIMSGLIIVFSALGGTTGSIITGNIFGKLGGQTAFYFSLIPIGVLLVGLFFFKKLQAHPTI